MWDELPKKDKEEYKKMILAFASLTKMFSQKIEELDEIPAPIINSKYQETIFQKAFHASAEDIGNTSYDVAISKKISENRLKRYLVGIKTFGIDSGDQKVAQFKANINEWSSIINQIQKNAKNSDGTFKSKNEVNEINKELYKELASEISRLRNKRIDSSIANLQGFTIKDDDEVESIYHVLMPSKKGSNPKIYVGETSYDKIDIDKIEILGCSSNRNPSNFLFTDGKHTYKYTSADSQLYMKFNNSDIVLESWPVLYAKDAYSLFSDIADKIYGKEDKNRRTESYSWKIVIQRYSGFNSFFGVGSKLATNEREKRVTKLIKKYQDDVNNLILKDINILLKDYLLNKARSEQDRQTKECIRNKIVEIIEKENNEEFADDVKKLIYRPTSEMYIPIPNSRAFHEAHPNFFGEGVGRIKEGSNKLLLKKEEREFNLIFEPSGDSVLAFIAQDEGKAIESVDKQTVLGEWILKKIFQLKDFEPLTEDKLNDIGINGIRLYKNDDSNDVHLEFIWINEELPEDYIGDI